jgi:hypothetical protein
MPIEGRLATAVPVFGFGTIVCLRPIEFLFCSLGLEAKVKRRSACGGGGLVDIRRAPEVDARPFICEADTTANGLRVTFAIVVTCNNVKQKIIKRFVA